MVCGAEEGIGLHPHCLTLRLGQDGNQCDVGQPMLQGWQLQDQAVPCSSSD